MYPNIYKSLILVTFLLSLTQTNANNEEEEIQNPQTQIVQLNGGQVQGVVRETKNGNKINFFQGIRFGRAKRFSRSTPVEPWTGQIYDATQKKAVCPQPGIGQPMMPDSSEDCLFLNVWQPTAKPTKNQTLRSVMVWIHGGGFFAWSINSFDAIRFAEIGDLVVVSLNYRLGPLGFLGFDTEEEPGNLGLHDQILGLKWIQENIERFGGNPDDVTIFGESAGAISIGALILSPLTSGLFHRAILQSGSPLVEQFVESKQNSLHKTIEFAERMNCRKADHVLTMKCLRETPLVDLIQSAMVDFYHLNSFVPIHDDELLPLAPVELLKQPLDRPLDLMFGVTRDEGTLLISQMFPEINMDQLTPELARNAMQTILDRLKIHDNDNSIIDFYSNNLNNQTTLDELRFAVSNVFGDYLLSCPTILFGKRLAHFSRAKSTGSHFYAYRLMTTANLTVPKHLESKFPKWLGISHGSDLVFQFDVPYFGARLEKNNEQFELVSRHMIEAWTQFAKTGQISPVSGVEWTEALDPSQQPEQQSSVKYFSIDPTDYKMVENYWSDICDRIWEPILMKTTGAKSDKTEL